MLNIHDKDFAFFSNLDGVEGMFLDVGANAGQSATSLMNVNTTLKVFSLEPNKEHEGSLVLLSIKYPNRFTFRMVGASDKSEQKQLFIPRVTGLDLSVNAATNLLELQKPDVLDRLNKDLLTAGIAAKYQIEAIDIQVIAIDELHSDPCVIKFDVEGAEKEAIIGSAQTIQAYHPILMIENNNFSSFARHLFSWGYKLFRYLPDENCLIPITWRNQTWVLNHFWLHPLAPERVMSKITPLVR